MTKNFLKQSFFVRFRAIYRAVSKSLTSLYNFSVAASGLISAGEKALPKTIFSPPFLSYSPVIANGTITAPPLWAMATTPGLNGNKSASVLLRVPSGKIPTAPPLFRIFYRSSDRGGIEAVAVDGYAARPSEKRGERTVKILALGHIIDNSLCR